MHIPSNIDDALVDLKGLGELVTASEWERAAIVWAFTKANTGRPKKVDENIYISTKAFADLKISGLRNAQQIRRYRGAWARAMEAGFATDVKPGDEVRLPDVEWHDYASPQRSPKSDVPKPDPQAEADLLNAVRGCLTSERLQHYSPQAKKHLVRILKQALRDLEEH